MVTNIKIESKIINHGRKDNPQRENSHHKRAIAIDMRVFYKQTILNKVVLVKKEYGNNSINKKCQKFKFESFIHQNVSDNHI